MSETAPAARRHRTIIDLDTDSGQVLAIQAGDVQLPEADGTTTWQQLLGIDEERQHPVNVALSLGCDVPLPVFAVKPPQISPALVSGEIKHQRGAAGPVCSLLLDMVISIEDLRELDDLQQGDAMLTVLLPHRPVVTPENDNSGLTQVIDLVLGERDYVAVEVANGVLLGLRATDLKHAEELAAHMTTRFHANVANDPETIHIGISTMDRDLVTAMESANNAAARAALDPEVETPHLARADDARVITELGSLLRGVVPGLAVIEHKTTATAATVNPMETGISGYVTDNMEGAVDQALFLAKTEVPVAVIGPRGTGKMYLARLIHDARSPVDDDFLQLNCRELGARSNAMRQIDRALRQGEGKTLVFKSPHLLHPEAQLRLARQLANRTQADTRPRRYLPNSCYIALFPIDLQTLVKRGELQPKLASVFAGYPIEVPPLCKRGKAILRWAHKILEQESLRRDRVMRGFTPDAEVALRDYNWPGNITEMRSCICRALDGSDTPWLSPLDLNLFPATAEVDVPKAADKTGFLSSLLEPEQPPADNDYQATPEEQLNQALGAAVAHLRSLGESRPLGTWLEDEIIIAALARFRQDNPRTARFLQTRPRNIARRMEKISARFSQRQHSALWEEPTRLIRQWLEEYPQQAASPLLQGWDMLLRHVQSQMGDAPLSERAAVMGVSAPTLKKRLEVDDDG